MDQLSAQNRPEQQDSVSIEKSHSAPSFGLSMIVTWFGAGLSPKAPGTVGSLAALPFAWGLSVIAPVGQAWLILLIASALVFALGWWASGKYVEKTGVKDPGLIVIDEVAGVWLTIALSYLTTGHGAYLLSFLMFRVFDILKPWPISWFDRTIDGGLGIMLDDILAGAIAAIPVYIVMSFFPLPLP